MKFFTSKKGSQEVREIRRGVALWGEHSDGSREEYVLDPQGIPIPRTKRRAEKMRRLQEIFLRGTFTNTRLGRAHDPRERLPL